jgi:predicted CXXCH cytochrome family protein
VRVALPLLLLTILAIGIYLLVRTGEPPAPEPRAVAAAGNPEWAGSAACAPCHPELNDRWAKSGHALGTREFVPDAPKRPFDGEVFVARDRDHRLGPGPSMTCEGPGGDTQTFPVDLVLGVRRVQMFTTTLSGGRIQVLPVFLEVPPRRWFDYTDFIFGGPNDIDVPPDSAYSWYGPHRNFSSRCGRCHTSDFTIGYDPDAGSYKSTWSELVVGCETCHGPGQSHIRKWRVLEPGPDPIVNPIRLTVDRALAVCGSCHSESTMIKPGFQAGDDFFEFFETTGLEDERHVHPDGRARELMHNYMAILESKCGPISCTHCHDAHGRGKPGDLYRPLSDDWFCTQCHDDIGANLTEHTHHLAESEGSRCITCHMPRLVIEGGHGRVYDHTISTPSMRNTKELGLPNACRSCHLEEFPGWEYEYFDKWYPGAEERNHRNFLAATLTAGRQQRPEAKDDLLKLLKDENFVYRAAAAWALLHYPVDLRPALKDPHPLVRRAAVEGVAARHPAALEPMVDDENIVLRRAAALALASRRERAPFDYIAARPELRARVRTVLEECAFLRPDHADLHFTLAKLYELDERPDAARISMARYKLLRPWEK